MKKPRSNPQKTAQKTTEEIKQNSQSSETLIKSDDADKVSKSAAKPSKAAVLAKLTKQFNDVRETLISISDKKQVGKIKWALKTLTMAEEAASRAVHRAE